MELTPSMITVLREEFRGAVQCAIRAGVNTELIPKDEMAKILREEAAKLDGITA